MPPLKAKNETWTTFLTLLLTICLVCFFSWNMLKDNLDTPNFIKFLLLKKNQEFLRAVDQGGKSNSWLCGYWIFITSNNSVGGLNAFTFVNIYIMYSMCGGVCALLFIFICCQLRLHSGAVWMVSTVTSQQECPGFNSQLRAFLCVEFDVFPTSAWVFSRYSGFLPQSKNMQRGG